MNRVDELLIKGFKCFEEYSVSFKNFTVLAGMNSTGKSTVVQSILLSRGVIIRAALSFPEGFQINVPLKGDFLMDLGNTKEVINSKSENIEFHYKTKDGKEFVFILGTEDVAESKVYLKFKKFKGEPKNIVNSTLGSMEFYYLNAERMGPRTSYDLNSFIYDHVGWQGEFAVELFSKLGMNKIKESRAFGNSENLTLRSQVIEWMNKIVPGIDIEAEIIHDINKVKVSYRGSTAPNVGFGISYVLPIIVNGLIAEESSLLIVENPEAHLHPSGQTEIGKFLAMIANTGVQVILETHSEHVVAGARIYWLEKRIDPNEFLVNFFSFDLESDKRSILEIGIDNNADLSFWPKGFFDQTEKEFAKLVELRKKHNA